MPKSNIVAKFWLSKCWISGCGIVVVLQGGVGMMLSLLGSYYKNHQYIVISKNKRIDGRVEDV